ncbi:MAG: hypothetical protein WCW77_05525 [Patescibacteria group bacterium]|jgi:hypothetical protein
MKRSFNKTWGVISLSVFILSGLNFCVLLLPIPAMASEEQPTSRAMPRPVMGTCGGHATRAEAPVVHPAKGLSADSDSQNGNTVLPCCANHEKTSLTDLPKEKDGFHPIIIPAQALTGYGSYQIYYNSSGYLFLDLPPPEAGLISSIFKKE